MKHQVTRLSEQFSSAFCALDSTPIARALEIDMLETSSVEYGFFSISRSLYEPVEEKKNLK